MIIGKLYVVATPIGNLEDITLRAISILKQVNLILAEDTRHGGKLLNHYGIQSRLLSFHDHNEPARIENLLELLQSGKSVALISDAGTPLINDPGYHLVKAAHDNGVQVIPVPGPSALLAALSVAGIPTDRFVYEGFLPARQSARINRLNQLSGEQRTLVIYEVPHRLKDTLYDMVSVMGGQRFAVLCKELTKQYETVQRDTLEGLLQWLDKDTDHVRGEFVIVLSGCGEKNESDEESSRVLSILLEQVSVKDASNLAAKILGVKKNQLYQLALELSNEDKK